MNIRTNPYYRGIVFSVLCAMTVFTMSCGSESSEDDTTAPTVVSITPTNGATGVNTTTAKRTVVFSDPMSTGCSVGMGTAPETFPVSLTTDPVWVNDTTIELPLIATLDPGTTYDMGLNNGTKTNFKDKAGNQLAAYTYSFTTAP
jgi:hypothetical protein